MKWLGGAVRPIAIAAALCPGLVRAANLAVQPVRPVLSEVPAQLLFGACLQAAQAGAQESHDFSSACIDAFNAVVPGASTSLVASDCQEFAGRVSEAQEEGYLGDGKLLCGQLVHERALGASRPLVEFLPSQDRGGVFGAFCDVMRSAKLGECQSLKQPEINTARMNEARPQVAGGTFRALRRPSHSSTVDSVEVPPPEGQSTFQAMPEVPAALAALAPQVQAQGPLSQAMPEVPAALAALAPQAQGPLPQVPLSNENSSEASARDRLWSNLATLLHQSR